MCGIAGYVAPQRPHATEHAVRIMMNAMARRGPDAEGVAAWPGTTLGHRRLAILDLTAAANQPMLSEDGEIGVVFNGCIYNFLELRGELEKCGHRFRSRCDTEVVLHGYRQWGIDGLTRRARGMFAFGVWDEPRRTLTLARDRLGVKPLVYSNSDGEIAFASTIAALGAAGFGGEIDPQAVLDLLEYGYITDEHAIYHGIRKLPPATILEWHEGQVTERRYWSLPKAGEYRRISFEEAVEETERLLLDAVRLRLFADVPLGVLLSGGIDSALVCWAMQKLNANIQAFTVKAPDDPSDESAAAARTARLLDIPHEIVSMPETQAPMDELMQAFGEPFGCQSAHAMLCVSRAVKRRATVLLTGDGGDDVFLGYPFFRNAWMAQEVARRLPPAAPAAWRVLRRFVPASGPARRLRSFLDYATGGLGAHARAHDGLPYFERWGMLGARLARRQLPQRQIPASLESARRLLSDVFAYHRRMHFTSEFMPKVDGATMHHSIEARAPFFDQEIWEFAAALPPGIRLRGGRLKAVLREIVRRRVGPEVAFRKKRGFTVPVEQWLATRWSGMLDELREDTLLERDGWIRRGALREPIQAALNRRRVPVQVWNLLVLEHWLRKNAGRSVTAGV